MDIHQLLAAAAYGDAISDYAFEIRGALHELGYRSEIFASSYDQRLASEVKPLHLYPGFSNEENIVIVHFSISSAAFKLAYHLKEKKILIYHNITPAELLLDFHPNLAADCYHGRRELAAFVKRCDLAVGVSEFNRKELSDMGFPDTAVLPLFVNFKKFDKEGNKIISRIFRNGKTTFLYVGRIIPNKRVEDVIRVFHYYKNYIDPYSRLILVGEYRSFEQYYNYLQDLLFSLRLTDVHFTGLVPLEELISYYRLANLFLIMSEHEGFCLPIIEAYYFGLPVIAFAAGAVPETMGGSGILVKEKNYPMIAELAKEVIENADLRKRIIAREKEVLTKHLSRDFKGELKALINRVAGG
jgi:glycosyltransferase involved in cell wall biosynthesis